MLYVRGMLVVFLATSMWTMTILLAWFVGYCAATASTGLWDDIVTRGF